MTLSRLLLFITLIDQQYMTFSRCYYPKWGTIHDSLKVVITLSWAQYMAKALYLERHFEVSGSDAFDWAIGEVIGRLILTTVFRSRSGDKQWFDDTCRRAYDAKQTAYHAWCRVRSADHWGRFVPARAEAQRVYGAARETHNEHTRILWSTPPVHISGGTHLKAWSLEWSRLFLLSGGPEVV